MINNRYKTSKEGNVIRTPLKYSECKRFVFAKVEFTNKVVFKWYFKCARQFKILISEK
jgi:hypothetical protein